MSEYIRDYEELEMPFRNDEIKAMRSFFIPHFSSPRREAFLDNPNNWVRVTEWRMVKNPSSCDLEKLCHGAPGCLMNYGQYKDFLYKEIVEENERYAVWLVEKAQKMSERDRRYMGWLIWMSRQGKL